MERIPDEAGASFSDDAGSAPPTPLFLAFLGALALSAVAVFWNGFGVGAVADFLLLAAVITGATLVMYAFLMIWATRAAQRADALALARPGALVVRAGRARGLSRMTRALRTEVPFVPLGLTLVADHTGLEVWVGPAEHPIRLARAPWEAVVEVRVTRVTRFGRAAGGLTVIVRDGEGGAAVELPVAVLGSGLGGLSVPTGVELEAIAEAIRERRTAAQHAAL